MSRQYTIASKRILRPAYLDAAYRQTATTAVDMNLLLRFAVSEGQSVILPSV